MDDNSWFPNNDSHNFVSTSDHDFAGSQVEEYNNVHSSSQSENSTFNILEAAKKRILMKANKSWKYKKTTLYAICDETCLIFLMFIYPRNLKNLGKKGRLQGPM
ncbi:hypothetical protein MKW92_003851 [Papaver armeniacum]|nr:hypothetical protein MKW92_003851 [Papaver armeniacum]